MTLTSTQHIVPRTLTIHTDGGSRGNPGPAATGVVILDDSGQSIHQFGRFLGTATNNEAEYLAVYDALNWIITTWLPNSPTTQLYFKLDSKLVVEQIERRWKIKEPRLFDIATKIWDLIQSNHLLATFTYIPRAQNADADRQVNLALDSTI